LQSTVEELQTTNEELQSTNEEMETMNEELQSSNEELQAMNEELRRRTVELDQVNSFLQSILASVPMAVVVIDRALNVLLWNGRAEDLWGLRASEVLGRSLLDLDIGLPVSKLVEPMRAFLDGQTADHEVVVEAINRRGRTIQCRVTFNLHMGPEGERRGVVLLMEEEPSG
jgi:two-component system CheB/CheR fusion protein